MNFVDSKQKDRNPSSMSLVSPQDDVKQTITPDEVALLVDFAVSSHSATASPPIQLTICAYAQVAALLREQQFDAVLSIKDPKYDVRRSEISRAQRRKSFEKHCSHVLCLDFNDYTAIGCGGSVTAVGVTMSGLRLIWPQEHHIAAIVEFARGIKNNARVLVHCMAGISRSAAAAMIILQEKGQSYSSACAEVLRVRSQAVPNVRMLYLYEVRKSRRVFAATASVELPPSDERVVETNKTADDTVESNDNKIKEAN